MLIKDHESIINNFVDKKNQRDGHWEISRISEYDDYIFFELKKGYNYMHYILKAGGRIYKKK